jgi:tetratricopeptide (TPR) repeat protein
MNKTKSFKTILVGSLAAFLISATASGVTLAGDETAILPKVPMGAEAISLMGQPLPTPNASAKALAQYDEAKAEYMADPDSAIKLIWYGRRAAYLGHYRKAIKIFTDGIKRHPTDARMYRHRGHRYISIRELDRSITDYEMAAKLIKGKENHIEPDGQPNSRGIPLSTTQGNIWYHYGLASYLKQDWDKAFEAFSNGLAVGENDDNIVSTTHWRYMILRRSGKSHDEAKHVLDVIKADMNVIENFSYYRLCMFYKGLISLEEMSVGADDPSGAASNYGLANWHYYNGNLAQADKYLKQMLAGKGWAGFGFIAAEADMASR